MTPAPAEGTPPPVPGRCLCGAVRFSLALPTLSCSHCHCESCRRWQSVAVATWICLPRAQLTLATGGELLRRYESSPGVVRSFCGRCGSPLFYESAEEPAQIYVTRGSLDGDLDRAPERHVSVEERAPWLAPLGDGLPRYRGKDQRLPEP